ncbi:MAG: pantetheine-phosphate adenylyltransferase [Bacteroidota bacterium]
MKKAVFAGSFDPITLGHVEIVQRGAKLFDEVIVAIGINSAKKYYFSLEQRLEMLRRAFAAETNIRVASYEGLTIEFVREQGARFLLRGLRNPQDLAYEQPIELINKHMDPEIEVVHLLSSPQYVAISSTIVREVLRFNGKVEGLLPEPVIEYLAEINS